MNWNGYHSLNPESAEPPNLPDDLAKQGNPVSGRFAKKLEVWRNALIKKPEKPLPPPTLEKLNKRVGVHQKAMEHLKTLKDDFTTRDRIPFHMSLFHKNNNDPAGAKAWAEISKQYNQSTKGIPEHPIDPLIKTFAQSSKHFIHKTKKAPIVHGTSSSPCGVHDWDEELFHPSPEVMGKSAYDLDPVEPMRLERIYDHRGLFQRDERGIRYFDFLYPEDRVRGYHENNKPKPGEPGDDEDVAIEMDLERDIEDFLGIDPDAPEEDAPAQDTPMPEPDEVDGDKDLGDDGETYWNCRTTEWHEWREWRVFTAI